MNSPLKQLERDFNKKNLIIDVCKQGRHRSVGVAETQIEAVSHKLYNHQGWPDAPRVQRVHLQEDTHWQYLCDRQCAHCNPNSEANGPNLKKAFDVLKTVVPPGVDMQAPDAYEWMKQNMIEQKRKHDEEQNRKRDEL